MELNEVMEFLSNHVRSDSELEIYNLITKRVTYYTETNIRGQRSNSGESSRGDGIRQNLQHFGFLRPSSGWCP